MLLIQLMVYTTDGRPHGLRSEVQQQLHSQRGSKTMMQADSFVLLLHSRWRGRSMTSCMTYSVATDVCGVLAAALSSPTPVTRSGVISQRVILLAGSRPALYLGVVPR